MKALTLKTITCLLLALTTLLSASCGLLPPRAVEDPTTYEELRLTVETVQVLYTTEETEEFSHRLTQTVCDICYLREGLVLNEEKKQLVANYVGSDILPMLAEIGITAEELGEACVIVERLIANADRNSLPGFDTLCQSYQEGLAVLGNERMGAVLYESILLWLDRQIAICDERYEKYQYSFYLEDGNRYRSRRMSLTETVGREDFSVMSGFWFFTLSTVSGAAGEEFSFGNSLLNDAEILMLLRRQATYFNEKNLSGEQWRIVSELLFSYVLADASLPDSLSPTSKAVLSALKADEDYAARVGLILPDTLALYKNATERLTADDVAVLQSTDEIARAAVICRVLAEDEAVLLNWVNAVSLHASSADEGQAKALKKLGLTDAYGAYANEIEPITEDALLAAIRDHGTYANDETYAALRDAEERLVFAVLPYVAFAFYGV